MKSGRPSNSPFAPRKSVDDCQAITPPPAFFRGVNGDNELSAAAAFAAGLNNRVTPFTVQLMPDLNQIQTAADRADTAAGRAGRGLLLRLRLGACGAIEAIPFGSGLSLPGIVTTRSALGYRVRCIRHNRLCRRLRGEIWQQTQLRSASASRNTTFATTVRVSRHGLMLAHDRLERTRGWGTTCCHAGF